VRTPRMREAIEQNLHGSGRGGAWIGAPNGVTHSRPAFWHRMTAHLWSWSMRSSRGSTPGGAPTPPGRGEGGGGVRPGGGGGAPPTHRHGGEGRPERDLGLGHDAVPGLRRADVPRRPPRPRPRLRPRLRPRRPCGREGGRRGLWGVRGEGGGPGATVGGGAQLAHPGNAGRGTVLDGPLRTTQSSKPQGDKIRPRPFSGPTKQNYGVAGPPPPPRLCTDCMWG